MQLFASQGYRRTSVDDVAREANVAKGTVYTYFATKQDLLVQAIAEEKRRFGAVFDALFKEELAPDVRLRRYIELGLTTILSAPLAAKLLTGDREIHAVLEDLGTSSREQFEVAQEATLTKLLTGVGAFDLLSPEERSARVKVLLGLLYAAPVLLDERLLGELRPERFAQVLARTIVDGIGSR